jgi:hypothetical protein
MSITLSPSELPSYLQNSAFYSSLGQHDGPFDVPVACFKVSTKVARSRDLYYLLYTEVLGGK